MKDLKKMCVTLVLGAAAFTLAFYAQVTVEKRTNKFVHTNKITTSSPPCLQVFYAIEKYAEEYGIPKNFAYGIAFRETRYEGPFQWKYKHSQTSSAGAVGPMQVMPSTARGLFPKKKFTEDFLRNDIDFNVECSLLLLRKLHDKYHDWKLVFGAYNTGKPVVNQYAEEVFKFTR